VAEAEDSETAQGDFQGSQGPQQGIQKAEERNETKPQEGRLVRNNNGSSNNNSNSTIISANGNSTAGDTMRYDTMRAARATRREVYGKKSNRSFLTGLNLLSLPWLRVVVLITSPTQGSGCLRCRSGISVDFFGMPRFSEHSECRMRSANKHGIRFRSRWTRERDSGMKSAREIPRFRRTIAQHEHPICVTNFLPVPRIANSISYRIEVVEILKRYFIPPQLVSMQSVLIQHFSRSFLTSLPKLHTIHSCVQPEQATRRNFSAPQ